MTTTETLTVWTITAKHTGFYGVSKITTDHYATKEGVEQELGKREAHLDSYGFTQHDDGIWRFQQRKVEYTITSQNTTPIELPTIDETTCEHCGTELDDLTGCVVCEDAAEIAELLIQDGLEFIAEDEANNAAPAANGGTTMTKTFTLTYETNTEAIIAAYATPGVEYKATESDTVFVSTEDEAITLEATYGSRFRVVQDLVTDPGNVAPSKRFVQGMSELRKAGFVAKTAVKMCCRGCISADAANKLGYTDEMDDEEIPLIWTYGSQGSKTALINDGHDLTINHSHITPELYEEIQSVFNREGLETEWDGSQYQCISVSDLGAVKRQEMITEATRIERIVNDLGSKGQRATWAKQDADREAAQIAREEAVLEWASNNLRNADAFTLVQLTAMKEASSK